MPTYDYVCLNCAQLTEVMHRVDAAGPSTCDVCGGPMRKALSTPAIVFKGSGWAKKDARTAAHSRVSDDKHKPTSESTAETDKKPATTDSAGASSD